VTGDLPAKYRRLVAHRKATLGLRTGELIAVPGRMAVGDTAQAHVEDDGVEQTKITSAPSWRSNSTSEGFPAKEGSQIRAVDSVQGERGASLSAATRIPRMTGYGSRQTGTGGRVDRRCQLTGRVSLMPKIGGSRLPLLPTAAQVSQSALLRQGNTTPSNHCCREYMLPPIMAFARIGWNWRFASGG